MITILLLSGAIREILMLSCTAKPAQCIPGKLQSDDYKKSKHRAYALCIQWKIPWSPPIRIWSSDLHQFYNSLVSLHALEELLWNDVSCSHMKLMESFLIVQIAGWLSDNMATCLWRVGIHDYDWHFILCFRILCKSSTFQSLIVLIWHQRNESTSSLVNIQIMHFAILYAKLMKVCAVTSSALDAFEQAWVAHWLWRNSEKLLLWSEANSCNVLKPLSANLIAYISVNGMGSPRADMSWPQGDFGSMELQDSDQYGCTKQRHSESVIVTELSCGLAFELQNGAEDFQARTKPMPS